MAEATDGLMDPQQEAEELEREIRTIRDDLDQSIGELDRRRRELTDWRLQLRRHKLAVFVTLGSVATLVGGLVALRVWRHRREQRPGRKLHRLREAVGRMIEHPERVAQPAPGVGRRVLASAGSAVTSVLGKRLLRR